MHWLSESRREQKLAVWLLGGLSIKHKWSGLSKLSCPSELCYIFLFRAWSASFIVPDWCQLYQWYTLLVILIHMDHTSPLSHLSTFSSYLAVIVGGNLLSSFFSFTFKPKFFQRFISSQLTTWFRNDSQKTSIPVFCCFYNSRREGAIVKQCSVLYINIL